jgi:hypothetical protein
VTRSAHPHPVLVTALLLLLGSPAPSHAALITGITAGDPKVVTQGKYTVSLKPTPVEHLTGPTDADLALLNAREGRRPGRNKRNAGTWTFEKGQAAAPGTFEVLQYAAFIDGDVGGADFVVLYNDGLEAVRTKYNWVQIARPDDWGRFGSTTSVDATFNNYPFYGELTPPNLPGLLTPNAPGNPRNPGSIFKDAVNFPQQKLQNPAGGGKIKAGDLLFNDEPFCSLSCSHKDGHAEDIFDLFLAEFEWNNREANKAGGTVTLYDGIRWGVQITCDDDPDDGAPGGVECASAPEPSTAALLIGGLVVLSFRRLCVRAAPSDRVTPPQV